MSDANLILIVSAFVGAAYLMVTGQTPLASVLQPRGGAVAPAQIQQSPSIDRNFASYVAQAKAELEAAGEDLSGPCGAFRITRRSAQMIGGDCGILSKPAGNNCDGYATDIHIFRDGLHYDVLVDGGGENGPTYSLIGPIDDPSRWRAP